MPKRTRPYRESFLASLADPQEAAGYLSVALEDSPGAFLKALRNVAQARQMSTVAKEAEVTREGLYRATSEEGNPTLDTLLSVLSVLKIKTLFAAEGAVSIASPTIVPQVRQKPARTTKRGGFRAIELRNVGQLRLAFAPPTIRANIPNALTNAARIARSGMDYWSSNPNQVIQREGLSANLNQAPIGPSFPIISAAANTQVGLSP